MHGRYIYEDAQYTIRAGRAITVQEVVDSLVDRRWIATSSLRRETQPGMGNERVAQRVGWSGRGNGFRGLSLQQAYSGDDLLYAQPC